MIYNNGYRDKLAGEVLKFTDRSEVLKDDMEHCDGLESVQAWVETGPSQSSLEQALIQIRMLRLGYKPDHDKPGEILQAKFARSGEKIVRTAITAANSWHDENFYKYKPHKKVGWLPYHCQQ
jgi:hypothetical protein